MGTVGVGFGDLSTVGVWGDLGTAGVGWVTWVLQGWDDVTKVQWVLDGVTWVQ